MKRTVLPVLLMLVCCLAAGRTKDKGTVVPDTARIVKTGWNFGPLPVVSYNSDLGFQYGVCCDMYNYSDGKIFPRYRDHFYVELSRYTKQQTLAHIAYDSNYLIPGISTNLCASFQLDPLYFFYGFNGIEPYDKSLNLNPDLRSARYNYQRMMVRVLADFQGPIIGEKFRWAAGIGYWWNRVDPINGLITLKNKDGSAKYDPSTTIYNEYVADGVINADEAAGGHNIELKAGLVYDTRNFAAAPDRGIWAELFLSGSPDICRSGYRYLKLCAHFRHYVTLWKDRAVFAYHLAYQGTIAGEQPFYMLPNINNLRMLQTSSEGLGGINTVRCIMPARLLGGGVAWSNIEFRIRIVSFNFIKQSWYLATNPFFDCGMVVQPYRLDRMASAALVRQPGRYADYDAAYSDLRSRSFGFHSSAGLGLKLGMNQNFILSVEAGWPLRRDDGPFCLNIGFNYIF